MQTSTLHRGINTKRDPPDCRLWYRSVDQNSETAVETSDAMFLHGLLDAIRDALVPFVRSVSFVQLELSLNIFRWKRNADFNSPSNTSCKWHYMLSLFQSCIIYA